MKSKHVRQNYTGNTYGILKLRVQFISIEIGARSKNEVLQITVAGAALITAVKKRSVTCDSAKPSRLLNTNCKCKNVIHGKVKTILFLQEARGTRTFCSKEGFMVDALRSSAN